ncbi:TetR/AcrR family transcriptional regulator [Streptomyces sp. NPDC097619]|uniref:TetR/AcrR family transcriptional regulator n=1 Tax=Streptomyces sp. NPDC097619 TaxID=3157228 RepID=UPI0033182CD0
MPAPQNGPTPAPTTASPAAGAARRPRKDALRNRAAVFAAADALFAERPDPEDVTMAEIAAAAGVGKGTLFRAFGDRTGLLQALYRARLEPLRTAVAEGPPPLGPGAPARLRVPALLDALLCFKLDNRHLALALERTGSPSGPYANEQYGDWHALLSGLLLEAAEGGEEAAVEDGSGLVVAVERAGFTAHALLAAVRADLVGHLAAEGHSPVELRSRLAEFTATVLGGPRPRGA